MVHLYADIIRVIASFADYQVLNRLSQVCAEARQVVTDTFIHTCKDTYRVLDERCAFLLKCLCKVYLQRRIIIKRAIHGDDPVAMLRAIKKYTGLCILRSSPHRLKWAIKNDEVLNYMINELNADLITLVPLKDLIMQDHIDGKYLIKVLEDPRIAHVLTAVVMKNIYEIVRMRHAETILQHCDYSNIKSVWRLMSVIGDDPKLCDTIFNHPTFVMTQSNARYVITEFPTWKVELYKDRILSAPVGSSIKLLYAIMTCNVDLAKQYAANVVASENKHLYNTIIWYKWDSHEIVNLALEVLDACDFINYVVDSAYYSSHFLKRIFAKYVSDNPHTRDQLIVRGNSRVIKWLIEIKTDHAHICTVLSTSAHNLANIVKLADIDLNKPDVIAALVNAAMNTRHYKTLFAMPEVFNAIDIYAISDHERICAYVDHCEMHGKSVVPIVHKALARGNMVLLKYIYYKYPRLCTPSGMRHAHYDV